MSRTEDLGFAREKLCELRSRLSGVASEGIMDIIDDVYAATTRAYEDKDLELAYEETIDHRWQFYSGNTKLLCVNSAGDRNAVLGVLNQVAVEAVKEGAKG